ncbi:LuxE/PaaK family acyltransferase [Thauera sinica]|uniref:Acyl-protein synthetase LuxE domain-containing protein n=1 Tax=Thauera sinica TaxID=2665146 RepID=A0ABW1AQQ3_9RHOO|nr:hypothetical protein [Thauera sp. K11]ATE59688.1 hypothetical protein CCZ27_06760 [Thauera sp. K11]
MNSLPHIEQLSLLADPYAASTADDEVLFGAAMAEADNWHRARNPAYAALWQGEQRPRMPVGLFKRVALHTPVEGDGVWLSSSGTGQQGAASLYFDTSSMARIERGMRQIFYHQGMISAQPARFLLLSPDPRRSPQPGYATSFLRFTACAPSSELIFAVDDAGRFLPDLAWETLTRWVAAPIPIFIFGLTVHFEHLALSAPSTPRTSNTQVRGLTGGGWKGMTRQLDRPEILARLAGVLGGGAAVDIRDIFGMTEHPLHYISCAHGRFHIPRYSRLEVVAADGASAPAGETGLIRLQNPFFASLPSHDLLSEDMGRMESGCACGSLRPWLEFLGRAGDSAATCAWQAGGGGRAT